MCAISHIWWSWSFIFLQNMHKQSVCYGNADSRTIQIILLSHNGRKRVNIRFSLFIYLKKIVLFRYMTIHYTR